MSDRDPQASVVIIHWNQPDACEITVGQFLDQDVVNHVFVVDNASDSSARAQLETAFAGNDLVTLLKVNHNSGFGPGANVGLRAFLDRPELGNWVVVAPHDAEPFPGTVRELMRQGEQVDRAGLLCADVGDDMTPVIDRYFGGMVVPADPAKLTAAQSSPQWEDVAYPHGTLMMLHRECLDDIGVFDERYFSYCEEAELALRAKRNNWRVGLIRGARVQNTHIGSSVKLVDYLQTRNTLLLVQEESGWYHAWIRSCITIFQTVRGVVNPKWQPLIFDARARLRGLTDFWLRRFGVPPRSMTVKPLTSRVKPG